MSDKPITEIIEELDRKIAGFAGGYYPYVAYTMLRKAALEAGITEHGPYTGSDGRSTASRPPMPYPGDS